jgi:hypothetical protein
MVRTLSAPLGLTLVILGCLFARSTPFPWPWALLPVCGTLLLIGGAHIYPHDTVRRWFSKSVPVWIGKRSYSLYLWHWPVYVLLRWTIGLDEASNAALALILTVALSMFSYHFVEQPLRHNRQIEKLAPLLIITLFISVTYGTYRLANHLFHHPDRYSLSVVVRHHSDWYHDGLSSFANMTPYECLPEREAGTISGGRYLRLIPKTTCAPQAKAQQQIFVIGDSHAEALFPSFEQLSAQTGIPITIYAYAGCGFIDFRAPMEQGFGADCNVFNREVTQAIIAQAKPGDLVILPSLRMKRFTDQWASFDQEHMQEQMYNEQANALRQAATQDAQAWLAPFSKAHLNMVFVAPLPIFKSPTFRCADWFNAHNPICAGGLSMSNGELSQLRAPILEQMKQVQAQISDLWVWDPFAILCPGEQCQAINEGRPLFFDGDHLSNYGNSLLYPKLLQYLQDHRLISNSTHSF